MFRIPTPTSGALSTMPRPRGGDWLDDDMVALRSAGVDVLVCLLTDDELRELDLVGENLAAGAAGLSFHSFPIVDMGVPDRERVQPLVAALCADLEAGRHVAVHCRAGIGRSSLIAAAVLVQLGVAPEQAWTSIGAARGIPVPETDEQRDWLTA